MKKRLQGLIVVVLIGAIITGSVVFAANTTTLYNVIANGIKIVVDGQKLNPTDANGNKVEPIIYNGTTYLPVRAVANALGKEVYWDGPNYTVYLGDMNGELEYPSLAITDATNIGDGLVFNADADELTDNYENTYSYALYRNGNNTFHTLLNMKYSRFKGVIYVPQGRSGSASAKVLVKADDKIIYSSPEITKTSKPIHLDLDIKGCNEFEIEIKDGFYVYLGDAGFYQ